MKHNPGDVESETRVVGHRSKRAWNWFTIVNVVIISGSWALYGYDNAFLTPVLALKPFIEKYQPDGPAFTADNLDKLVTVPLFGAASGAVLAVPLQHRLGRKWSMIVAYSLFCIPGSLLQLFAPNLAAFVCGRFWNNVGVGVLNTTATAYVGEIVPADVRGRTIGLIIVVGDAVMILATTIVWGTQKFHDSRSYRVPLIVQTALPAALAIITLGAVESPLWYMLHGKEEAARRSLLRLRDSPDTAQQELGALRAFITNRQEDAGGAKFFHILNRENIKRTLIAGAFFSISQVGGQILVSSYSTVILVQSGVSKPFQITVMIFVLQFLGVCIGPILMDKLGRRRTGIAGFSVLFLLDTTIGGLACGGLGTESQSLALAALFIIFAFFNALCFKPLLFLMPAELPAARYREATAAWTLLWSYVTAIITTFVIPQLTVNAGLGARTDLVFAGCMLITTVGSYFYLPETKGRTLSEIDEMLRLQIPCRKWRDYVSVDVVETVKSETAPSAS